MLGVHELKQFVLILILDFADNGMALPQLVLGILFLVWTLLDCLAAHQTLAQRIIVCLVVHRSVRSWLLGFAFSSGALDVALVRAVQSWALINLLNRLSILRVELLCLERLIRDVQETRRPVLLLQSQFKLSLLQLLGRLQLFTLKLHLFANWRILLYDAHASSKFYSIHLEVIAIAVIILSITIHLCRHRSWTIQRLDPARRFRGTKHRRWLERVQVPLSRLRDFERCIDVHLALRENVISSSFFKLLFSH